MNEILSTMWQTGAIYLIIGALIAALMALFDPDDDTEFMFFAYAALIWPLVLYWLFQGYVERKR